MTRTNQCFYWQMDTVQKRFFHYSGKAPPFPVTLCLCYTQNFAGVSRQSLNGDQVCVCLATTDCTWLLKSCSFLFSVLSFQVVGVMRFSGQKAFFLKCFFRRFWHGSTCRFLMYLPAHASTYAGHIFVRVSSRCSVGNYSGKWRDNKKHSEIAFCMSTKMAVTQDRIWDGYD